MTEEKQAKKLTKKQEVFVTEYLKSFNATDAYIKAHPKSERESAWSNASRMMGSDGVKEAITARLTDLHVGADEALKMQADIARAGLGQFFKISDEWTFYPLPTSEILDQKEVIDDTDQEKPVKRISYRERRVILDMDKVLDPINSRLIKKFTDNKNGLSIELYPADIAQERILKVHGKFKETVDITSGGEKIKGYIGWTPDAWKQDDKKE